MRPFVIFALTVAIFAIVMPSPGGPASVQTKIYAQTRTPSLQSDGSLNPPRSPRNANYTIDARLDVASRRITATEVILWRNVSNRLADELQFHLYWNAWKHTRSTWMRETALTSSVDRPDEDLSSIDVTSIKVGNADVTAGKRFIAPDDQNPDDQTVMTVPLAEPVPPGGDATIEVRWTARIPRPFHRTGAIGNYFFIAQWFPKLGVLQDDGWNTHQFHSTTEFFADYGVYDVQMTMPAGWIVGATGVERERRDNGDGTATHRYYQEDVHDFAWTTSPDYVVRTDRFEHPALPPVDIRLLMQPERLRQTERHIRAVKVALQRYGEWFGPYPYGHLTVIDPAFQSDAGGMEYPTLITAGASWLIPSTTTYWGPEDVTIHEAGHQWFYGVIGTNEFEDAWMDEGINTYAGSRALTTDYTTYHEERYFGDFVGWAFPDLPLRRETYWNRLNGYRNAAESDAPWVPSFQYDPRTGRAITYNKTALWLNTMERWLGWDVMQRSLATYFERWQFKHPKPQDFFDILMEVSRREDVRTFLGQVHRTSNVFDYGVQELTSVREGDRYRTTVFVRRYGEAIFPVEVAVTFENGETATELWLGGERWKEYVYTRVSRAVSAHVDPNRVLLLDVNYTNNSKSLAPRGSQAATKWALKWMVWLEDALLSWAFLA
jgi:peptidase M1-like protein